jgi:hypothetical protein
MSSRQRIQSRPELGRNTLRGSNRMYEVSFATDELVQKESPQIENLGNLITATRYRVKETLQVSWRDSSST